MPVMPHYRFLKANTLAFQERPEFPCVNNQQNQIVHSCKQPIKFNPPSHTNALFTSRNKNNKTSKINILIPGHNIKTPAISMHSLTSHPI
ncbi:hypothetical protein C9J01_10975 [Photobacterium rosenbergii]|uniref:Uncharacterized protein n=1 Tax=Photobacterium rosenbergii TaxID=294936 RepID=A0A2T3NFN2_9GAMM|nr:hypothetical protein C9J01_10975 [Photobacterium rosenbergii]